VAILCAQLAEHNKNVVKYVGFWRDCRRIPRTASAAPSSKKKHKKPTEAQLDERRSENQKIADPRERCVSNTWGATISRAERRRVFVDGERLMTQMTGRDRSSSAGKGPTISSARSRRHARVQPERGPRSRRDKL